MYLHTRFLRLLGGMHGRELAGTVMYLEREFQTSGMEAEVPVPRQQLAPSPLVQSRPAARTTKKTPEKWVATG